MHGQVLIRFDPHLKLVIPFDFLVGHFLYPVQLTQPVLPKYNRVVLPMFSGHEQRSFNNSVPPGMSANGRTAMPPAVADHCFYRYRRRALSRQRPIRESSVSEQRREVNMR